MNEVLYSERCRTAVGKFGGSLKDVTTVELAASSLPRPISVASIAPEEVDEVIFGQVAVRLDELVHAGQRGLTPGVVYQRRPPG